jgi:hypothetical protein
VSRGARESDVAGDELGVHGSYCALALVLLRERLDRTHCGGERFAKRRTLALDARDALLEIHLFFFFPRASSLFPSNDDGPAIKRQKNENPQKKRNRKKAKKQKSKKNAQKKNKKTVEGSRSGAVKKKNKRRFGARNPNFRSGKANGRASHTRRTQQPKASPNAQSKQQNDDTD